MAEHKTLVEAILSGEAQCEDFDDPCAAQTPSFSYGVSKRSLQQLAFHLSIK